MKYTITAPTATDARRIVDLMHKAFRFIGLGIRQIERTITFETDNERVRDEITYRLITWAYSPNVKRNDGKVYVAEPRYRIGGTDEYECE